MPTTSTLYCQSDVDMVRERKDDHDATAPFSVSSSFTAINQQQNQLLTPPSSATDLVQQNQARRRAASSTRRRRHPTVARYLGLGSAYEPTHLAKYAPLLDGPQSSPPKSVRKRRKLGDTEDGTHSTVIQPIGPRTSTQRRIFESLRVTRSRHKPAVLPITLASESSQSNTACPESFSWEDVNRQLTHRSLDESHYRAHDISRKRSPDTAPVDLKCSTPSANSNEQYVDIEVFGPNADDCERNASDQLNGHQLPRNDFVSDREDFDGDLSDEEFLKLTSDIINTGGNIDSHSSPSFTSNVPQMTDMIVQNLDTPSKAPIVVEEEVSNTQRKPKKFVSPITLTTRLLAATGDINTAVARKPIARPPFPVAVRDQSPVIGLSSNILLKTCFRIGEAINQAHQYSKSGIHIIFELYARILDSSRSESRQHFTLCDLFHGKPPHIKAVYDAIVWKPVQLFNYDSKRLLQQGRICRCMGTMRREGKEWTMTVLNIWEATWDDINWVEGIINS